MAAPGAVAAPAGMDRAPTTPVEALGAAEEDAPDPVMSFLEAVPWDGVSLSLIHLLRCFACVHFVLQMPMRQC